jgi:hypothetical protein
MIDRRPKFTPATTNNALVGFGRWFTNLRYISPTMAVAIP